MPFGVFRVYQMQLQLPIVQLGERNRGYQKLPSTFVAVHRASAGLRRGTGRHESGRYRRAPDSVEDSNF